MTDLSVLDLEYPILINLDSFYNIIFLKGLLSS